MTLKREALFLPTFTAFSYGHVSLDEHVIYHLLQEKDATKAASCNALATPEPRKPNLLGSSHKVVQKESALLVLHLIPWQNVLPYHN